MNIRLYEIANEVRELYVPNKEDDLPYIGLEHVEQGTLHISNVGSSQEVESNKLRFRTGDILFGTLRPYFRKVIIAPCEGVCSTEFCVVRPKESDDRYFVLYRMADAQFIKYATANSNGARPRTKWKLFSDFEFPQLPPIQRKKIGDILFAYDNLIENNRRRIQLLEQAAREIYKEWFVRLRFPGYEHATIEGGIPEGWERKQLREVVGTQYGFTETAADEPIGPKFLRGKDINKTSYIDWSSVPFCPEDKLNFGKYALHIDDIIVIRMADPGKVGIVETEQRAVFASYLVRLKRKVGVNIPALYLFYILSDDLYQGFISGASSGSTRKSASAKLLVDFNILIPPHELLAMLIDQIQPVRKQIQTLLQQNANLKQARDLLLPRLVSGDTEFHVKYEQPKETDRVYK